MYPDGNKSYSYQTDDEVYFFSNAFDPLNNWSGHQVRIWGKTFATAEHAYHYRKFSDILPEVAKQIKRAPSAWVAMQTERQYKDKRRADWEAVKAGIMEEIIRAKVAQNEDVRACLLKTGDRVIKENAVADNFWGVGPDGKGKNVMGNIFMQIRSELRKETA